MRCEIYPIGYRKSETSKKQSSFRWKWRHIADDGSVEESTELYELYYECVVAARVRGYQPSLRVN
jgi:hypothetical protein